MKPLLHLHFLSLLLLCCVSPSSFYSIGFHFKNPVVGLVSCHSHGIRALTQFKNEFDTRHCNHSDPFNGVWCDNSTGVVMYLQLRACLSGTLKPNSSLFQFHHLRYLVLSHNNFTSSLLSSQFGNINKLEVLILDSNGFLGQVPSSFNNLSFLSTLDLSQNKLTGSFPLIWNLTRLSVLDLSSNHFSGTLNPNVSLFMLHHLRYLNLGSNNFSSSLPSEFGNLENLEVVSLSSNGFFSQVPPTVSNLTWLTKLYLDQNKLTGNFQFVQNLTKLSFLDLHDNHFSGNIPSSLPSMPFLSYLDLCGNNLSGSIEIPNSTTSSRLEHLAIGHNNFKGNILKPISKLITLKHLDLSMQNISYPIDLSLFSSLQSLLFLDLSGNSISPVSLNSNSDILSNLEGFCLSSCGIMDFPNILKTLQKLQYLDISNNRITGKVPEWLWNLPHLSTLLITNNLFNGFEGSTDVLVNSSMKNFDLQLNHFEGPLPILPLSIKILAAGVNRFTGGIPPSICSCKSLTQLSLAYNNLTGPIPRCLSNLTVMDLRKNNLEGSIPDNFYVGASLRALNVGYNRLSGKLPRSLLNCSSLEFLNVDHNRIEDTFPFWLKALQNLQVLILRTNHFYGPISLPHQGPLGFAELRIFEISSNNFSGSLPPSYFVNWKASSFKMNEDGGLYMLYRENPYSTLVYNYFYCMDLQYKGLSVEQERVLTSYATIDFSGNRFEGAIPESLGRLKSLIALNLSNNAFTCHIPLSFANLGRLESLDLSNNQLSGTIPNGIGALSFLAYVNVSHNHLKGEIPQGTQITGQHKSSFEGNAGLCGLPLDESCFDTNFSPTQQPEENNEEVLNWKALVIGFGPGMLLGLAIAQLIASYKPEWLVYIIGPNKSRNR